MHSRENATNEHILWYLLVNSFMGDFCQYKLFVANVCACIAHARDSCREVHHKEKLSKITKSSQQRN